MQDKCRGNFGVCGGVQMNEQVREYIDKYSIYQVGDRNERIQYTD